MKITIRKHLSPILFSILIVSFSIPGKAQILFPDGGGLRIFSNDTSFFAKVEYPKYQPNPIIPNPKKLYPVGYTLKTMTNRNHGLSSFNYVLKVTENNMEISGGPAIYLKVDKNATRIFPYNRINTLTNFVYLSDAKDLHLFFMVSPKKLQDFRYRILINDTTEAVTWKKISSKTLLKDIFPDIHQPIPSIFENHHTPRNTKEKPQPKTFLLTAMKANHKKITLQYYNIHNPELISTVYLLNKPFTKPKINLSYTWKGGGRTINQYTGDSVFHKMRDLDISIQNVDAYQLYKVHIQRVSDSPIIRFVVNKNWELPDFSYNGRPNVSLTITNINKYFKKPGRYKIIVIPELPNYFRNFPKAMASKTFVYKPKQEESKEKRNF